MQNEVAGVRAELGTGFFLFSVPPCFKNSPRKPRPRLKSGQYFVYLVWGMIVVATTPTHEVDHALVWRM